MEDQEVPPFGSFTRRTEGLRTSFPCHVYTAPDGEELRNLPDVRQWFQKQGPGPRTLAVTAFQTA